MTDHRSPKDIEREIERERAGLTDTLDNLQERFSIDGIVRQIGDQFREHGGDIGASVSRSVRDNPMALALTGIGLAWMIFGNRNGDDRDNGHDSTRRLSRRSRSSRDYCDPSRHDADARSHDSYDSRPGRARGIAGPGNTPAWAQDGHDGHDRDGYDRAHATHDASRNRFSADLGAASDRASGMGSTVSDKASRAADAVSGAASDAADRARDAGASVAAGMRGVRDRASDAASQAADRAADLRARLSEGTETLGEQARERVIAARQRALEVRDAASGYARQGRDRAVDLFEEQPLITGALALAVGAAIGAAIPRTRAEDSYFGEQSDDLFHEAERIFAEEREKVSKVAHAAMDEAKDVVDETTAEIKDRAAKAKADADARAPADTAAQAVADRAKHAGQRIADAARDEADKQELGKTSF